MATAGEAAAFTAHGVQYVIEGHPCEDAIHRLSWVVACSALMLLAVLNVVGFVDYHRKTRNAFTDGWNSCGHFMQGMLGGSCIFVGLLARDLRCGRSLRSWCLLCGTMWITTYIAYDFAKSRIFAENIYGHHDGVLEDVGYTNFYASLRELACGGFTGSLLVAAVVVCLSHQDVALEAAPSVLAPTETPSKKPDLEEPLLIEFVDEDGDIEHLTFHIDESSAEPLKLQDFVYQSLPAVVPGLLLLDLVRYLTMPWSLISISGSMWDKMDSWGRRLRAVSQALAAYKRRQQYSPWMCHFSNGWHCCFPFLVLVALLIRFFGDHLYGTFEPKLAWPPAKSELLFPMIALLSNWLLTSFGSQYGIISERGLEVADRNFATDRVELAILVRLKALSKPLCIEVDKELVDHKGKHLKQEYRNALCEGRVPPIELAYQMRNGFLYPVANDALLRAMAVVEKIVSWLLRMINVPWYLGLALLPNLFRPGWDGRTELDGTGQDGIHLLNLKLRFPGCIGGWTFYMVYLMSIGTPRANLNMLIDSLQTARRMHWRQYSAVYALTTMLRGEKANRWLLPSVRMDQKYDLLVWSELCDLIDHQSLSAIFRLTEIALIFSILWIFSMVLFAGYVIWKYPTTFKRHILLVCYALYTAAYITFQVTRTMMAGVFVNWAQRRRLSAIADVVYRQRLMEAHRFVTGWSAAGKEGQHIGGSQAAGNQDSMQQPAATGCDQHDPTIQEFKSTMLFAEALLQRHAEKRGFVRLLGCRLEAYSIMTSLLSGWVMMAKLTMDFFRTKVD